MTPTYDQKGPRAHHFAGVISIAIGLSVFFEYYVSNSTFAILDGLTPLSGKHVWGLIFISLGILLFQPFSIILRAVVLILLSGLWVFFGGLSLYLSLFGPQAHTIGSAFGILAMAIASVCILASANVRRDFKPVRFHRP